MRENCLLCLSTFSGGGHGQGISSFIKLVNKGEPAAAAAAADDDDDDDEGAVLCSECERLIDSVNIINNSISQLQIKLKTEMEKIRNIIFETEGNALETIESRKLLRLRKSFLDFSEEKWSDVGDTPISAEMVQIKMETEEKEQEFDNYYDDGPYSPSAFMLEPEPNDEMEFEEGESFDIKNEVDEIVSDDHEEESRVPQKRKYKHKIRLDIQRRSTRVRQRIIEVVQEKKPVTTTKSQEKASKRNKTSVDRQRRRVKSLKGGKRKIAIPVKVEKKSKPSSHHRVPCVICGRIQRNKNVMIRHIFQKHETEDKPFSCEKCGKSFTLEMNLKRHIDLHEFENEKPIVCDLCDTRFADQEKLDVHLLAHNKKVYSCDICGRNLATHMALKRHIRIHTKERPYKCDMCDEGFIDKVRREYHIEKVHKKDEKYPCNICGKEFDTTAVLKIHLIRHAGKGYFSRKCDECGETFSSPEARKAHQIRAHGNGIWSPFICEECGATLKSKSGLARHKLAHSGTRDFKCEICEATFNSARGLKNHMPTHSTERPYVCTFCGQAFKFKANLSSHEKYLHYQGPGRNYKLQCPQCPKKFEYKSRLDGHIRQAHTGERPFACHVESCGQSFAIKTSLAQHLKSHGIFPSKTDRASRSKKDDACSASNSSSSTAKSKSNRKRRKEQSSSESEELSNETPDEGQIPNYSGNVPLVQNFPASSNLQLSFPSQFY